MNARRLSDIRVELETGADESGNLASIIHEIQYALQQLIEQHKTHSIDLRAMPWSAGEQQRLEDLLGRGEVIVELNSLGRSVFYETAYSGVWLLSHYNEDNEIIGRLIEVGYVPQLLMSPEEDVKDSLQKINRIKI